jgi:hypothetical protein
VPARAAARSSLAAAGALPILALTALTTAAPAHADRALSAGAGWATYSTLGDPPMPMKAAPTLTAEAGGHLQLTYEHGISREVSLRGELAGALFGDDWSYLALGDLGVVYRFDVVKYVPYGFAGVGGLVSGGGPVGSDLIVVLGGGLDVLSSRTRSWGIEGRLASFAGDTTVFTLGVRGSVRWGYF